MPRKHVQRLLSILVSAVLLTACGILPKEAELRKAPVAKEVKDAEYTMTPVILGDIVLQKNIRCEYKPARQEMLGFGVTGEVIDQIYVQVGDSVSEGDLLAELDTGDLKEVLEDEQWKMKELELSYKQQEEQKELALKKADAYVSLSSGYEDRKKAQLARSDTEEQYDLALSRIQNQITLQQDRLAEVEKAIRDRQIFATMDGSVTYLRLYGEDSLSREGETAMTLSDVASSVFLVKGEDAALLSVGMEVIVTYNDEEHEGVVVDPASLQLSSSNDMAYISLLVPDPALEEGSRGVIPLELDRREHVLIVKSSAIHQMGEQTIVYYLDEEGMKAMKEVTVGLDNGEFVEILDGLTEGEEIIDE